MYDGRVVQHHSAPFFAALTLLVTPREDSFEEVFREDENISLADENKGRGRKKRIYAKHTLFFRTLLILSFREKMHFGLNLAQKCIKIDFGKPV